MGLPTLYILFYRADAQLTITGSLMVTHYIVWVITQYDESDFQPDRQCLHVAPLWAEVDNEVCNTEKGVDFSSHLPLGCIGSLIQITE
jgi:hypothetical protein